MTRNEADEALAAEIREWNEEFCDGDSLIERDIVDLAEFLADRGWRREMKVRAHAEAVE